MKNSYITAIENILSQYGGEKYKDADLESFRLHTSEALKNAAEECNGPMKMTALKMSAKMKNAKSVIDALTMLTESMFAASEQEL